MNEDDLRKFGLRVRRRPEPEKNAAQPGKIAFDDRGNAIYEWNDQRLQQEGEDGERARRRALSHPGLSMVEDDPDPNAPIRSNPKGLRVGYNPYESGLLAQKERRPKRDLRELSKWIEMKKKVNDRPPEE